jgi:hypothetical protein
LRTAESAQDAGVSSAPTAERPAFEPPRGSTRKLLRRREASRRRKQVRRHRHRRERRVYGGGVQWEAAFFGLLVAGSLIALLVALAVGAVLAVGVTDVHDGAATQADRLSAGGGALLLAIVALAYLGGGYVAARMARFDGWRQGLGVWILTLLLVVAAAIAAWVAGGALDPTESISLPSDPVDAGPLGDGLWIAIAAAAVLALFSVVAGGILGERFHRAVDRAALEPQADAVEPELEPAAPEAEPDPDPDPEPATVPDPAAETEQPTEPSTTAPGGQADGWPSAND